MLASQKHFEISNFMGFVRKYLCMQASEPLSGNLRDTQNITVQGFELQCAVRLRVVRPEPNLRYRDWDGMESNLVGWGWNGTLISEEEKIEAWM